MTHPSEIFFILKNNQFIILFIIYLINIIIFKFLFESRNEKKKLVPKLRQEVKVKVDIVTSDDTKIYYSVSRISLLGIIKICIYKFCVKSWTT